MNFGEAMQQTKNLVERQQSAVRAENSGFGAGSGMMARATDSANAALRMHIRAMGPEQLQSVLIHLVVESQRPTVETLKPLLFEISGYLRLVEDGNASRIEATDLRDKIADAIRRMT